MVGLHGLRSNLERMTSNIEEFMRASARYFFGEEHVRSTDER